MNPLRLLLRIALRQIRYRKMLSFIAILGVALGVMALVVMNAIMKGFQERLKEQLIGASAHVALEAERVADDTRLLEGWVPGPGEILAHVSHHAPSDRPARISEPFELARSLEHLPEIEAACPMLFGQLSVSVGARRFQQGVRGILPNVQDRCTPLRRFVTVGRWEDFVHAGDTIFIGSQLAKDLSLTVGDRMTFHLEDGSARSLRISALFETGLYPLDHDVAFMHLNYAQSLLPLKVEVNRIDVRVQQPLAAVEVSQRLRRLTHYKVSSWIERNASSFSLFNLQNTVVGIQILAILTVGGFGILAIQIMIVLQKTFDIAILRSIGLRRRDILLIFMAQGTLLAFLGGLLGDLIGWRFIEFLDSLVDKTKAYSDDAILYMYKDPPSYLYGLLFAMTVGALASFLPAWRGARVEPVDVLRGRQA